MKRSVIQSILCFPAFCATPLGWIFMLIGHSPSTEAMLRESDPERTTLSVVTPMVYFFLSSSIGLAAMIHSMAVDPKEMKKKSRWLSIIGLIVGLQLVAYVTVKGIMEPGYGDFDMWLLIGWLLYGPAVSAIWNLRLLTSKTNKRTEQVGPHNSGGCASSA